MIKNYFSIGATTEKGKNKKVNEDNILVKIGEDESGEFGLFAVADGMGGLSNGEIASSIIINNLKAWWSNSLSRLLQKNSFELIRESLKNIIIKSNMLILEEGQKANKLMGTTISILFIYKNNYIIEHVGDSRIYIINNNIKQKTIDHSWVQEQVRKGKLTKEEAKKHPNRNIITQCLGINENIEIFDVEGVIKKDDIFFMCTDGGYKTLEENEILSLIYKENYDIQNKVDLLLSLARKNGEKDDISIILVHEY